MNRTVTSKLKFRPEIEGLRGVAVAAVTLFHLSVDGFTGGFLGVDVFFVISGYLISQVIAQDLGSGEFFLSEFYLRRAARILPALLAMLAVLAVVAHLLYFGDLSAQFGKWLSSSALFFSNIVYALNAGYFSTDSELNPLLHTWSLSVEEQYYFVIPLLLMFTRGNRAWRTHILVLSLSFVCADLLSGKEKTFFFSPARFWEFSLGSLVPSVAHLTSKRVRAALTFVGLASIGLSVWLFSGRTASPIPAPLIPVLGATAVLAGSADGLAGAILTSRPLRFLGRISYSVYLWHWPLIVVAHYVKVTQLMTADKLLIGGASVAIGYLSWRWVEVPARERMLERPRALFALALACVAALGAFGFVTSTGVFERSVPSDVVRLAGFATKMGSLRKCLDLPAGSCKIGDPSKRPSFVLWGDSFATSLAEEVSSIARAEGRAGTLVVTHSCPPLVGVQSWWRPSSQRCIESNRVVAEMTRNPDIDVVIMHANWDRAVLAPAENEERWELTSWLDARFLAGRRLTTFDDRLARTLDTLKHPGLEVVVITTVPQPRASVPFGLAVARFLDRTVEIRPSLEEFHESSGDVEEILLTRSRRAHARVIAPSRDLCDSTHCRVAVQNVPLYFDGAHLNAAGAKQLVGLLHLFDLNSPSSTQALRDTAGAAGLDAVRRLSTSATSN